MNVERSPAVDDVGTHVGDRGQKVGHRSDGRQHRRRALVQREVDFRWQRPGFEVLTRCANVASRAHMQRPQLRADLAENLLRTYDALWRRARVTHRATVDTTWRQLAVACGYEDDPKAFENGSTSIRRYLELLAEAGLIAYGGARTDRGAWSHLDVELVEPPALRSVARRRSSAGEATLIVCQARRRRESAAQRASRRRRPWRRAGGRADAIARRSLSWSSEVVSPLSEIDHPYGVGRSFSDAHAEARVGDARPPVAAAGAAAVRTTSRKAERARRRRDARIARLQAEARRKLADGEWVSRAERQRQADPGFAASLGRFACFLDSIPGSGGELVGPAAAVGDLDGLERQQVVEVAGRGGEVGVPEQPLDVGDRDALAQQLDGEGVT